LGLQKVRLDLPQLHFSNAEQLQDMARLKPDEVELLDRAREKSGGLTASL
jgi:hypothetical protein